MKQFLLFIAFVFTIGVTNAQYSVLLVNDNSKSATEFATIDTALAHTTGITYASFNIDTVAPTFSDMDAYDMVIWYTGNDGVGLFLWDETDTVVGPKFNASLLDYINAGGVVWLDGLDYLYDVFGSAPVDFNAGDFVYDVMGIDQYVAQSHADDSLASYVGCPMYLKTSTNTISTLDTIKWKWSSVWYADALDITASANSLYEMGPAAYDFAGKVSALYNYNVISTGIRMATIGDGSQKVQADLDLLVSDMVTAAAAGTFAPAPTPPTSSYSVLLVDDNAKSSTESATISTALTNAGFPNATYMIDSVAPSFDDLKAYDMVIWYTANDGVNLYLWDETDTVSGVKFNSALQQFIDSAGVVWVDGLDFLYDIYGSAPKDFAAGDFVYDVMGIEKYVAQSHADDSLASYVGCPMMLQTSNNTFNTLDTIQWKWSSIWYADALDITSEATALYEMGPADYDFAGKVSALYRYNVITSSIRMASIGDGSALDQDDLDLLIGSMVTAAENGSFPAPPPVGIKNYIEINSSVNIYPNPATDYVTISFTAINKLADIKVYDITGKQLINKTVDANVGSYRMNLSELNRGIYFVQVAIGNTTTTKKLSLVK